MKKQGIIYTAPTTKAVEISAQSIICGSMIFHEDNYATPTPARA